MRRTQAILASHSHYDHVLDLPAFAQLCDADVYGSASAAMVARDGDVSEEKIHIVSPGDVIHAGAFEIHVLSSQHSPMSRFNDDTGTEMTEPLRQPARLRDFHEGGPFDYYVMHPEGRLLLRPGCSVPAEEYGALPYDTLFFGVGPFALQRAAWKEEVWTGSLVRPDIRVIPIHHDDFFRPYAKPMKLLPVGMGQGARRWITRRCQEEGREVIWLSSGQHIDLYAKRVGS